MSVDSDSSTEETQAGAGVRGTSAGAGTQAAGVGAGTTDAGVGGQGRMAQLKMSPDIGVDEAWSVNLKFMFDEMMKNAVAASKQSEILVANSVAAANILVQQGAAAAGNLMALSANEMGAKMHASTDAVHKTTRTSLFEIDKLENINETDAYATMLGAKIAEVVMKRVNGEK